jgi:hypothetical protein
MNHDQFTHKIKLNKLIDQIKLTVIPADGAWHLISEDMIFIFYDANFNEIYTGILIIIQMTDIFGNIN